MLASLSDCGALLTFKKMIFKTTNQNVENYSRLLEQTLLHKEATQSSYYALTLVNQATVSLLNVVSKSNNLSTEKKQETQTTVLDSYYSFNHSNFKNIPDFIWRKIHNSQ